MPTVPEHIAQLIRDGRKIEAIKLLRQETDVDLQTAKEAVDRLDADPAFDPLPPVLSPGEVSEDVKKLAWLGMKIPAIKLLRQQSGLGLKEAKEVVEQLPRNPELPVPNVRATLISALVAVFLMALGIALAIYFLGTTS